MDFFETSILVISLDFTLILINVALMASNRPSLISPANVNLCKLKESLLKAACVTGFPKLINAYNHINASNQSTPSNFTTNRNSLSLVEIEQRGRNFFKEVYSKNTEKLLGILDAGHPDLSFLILNQYGSILADFTILDKIETELVLIIALQVQGGEILKQAKSHCIGAEVVGAKKEDINNVVQLGNKIRKMCFEIDAM